MFTFSTPIMMTKVCDVDSQDLRCISYPSSRQEHGRVFGHRAETAEKDVAKPKIVPCLCWAAEGMPAQQDPTEGRQPKDSVGCRSLVQTLANIPSPMDAINTSGGCHCNAEPKAGEESDFILYFLNKGIGQLDTGNTFHNALTLNLKH